MQPGVTVEACEMTHPCTAVLLQELKSERTQMFQTASFPLRDCPLPWAHSRIGRFCQEAPDKICQPLRLHMAVGRCPPGMGTAAASGWLPGGSPLLGTPAVKPSTATWPLSAPCGAAVLLWS